MTGPEKTVERAIVRALRARGALVIKTHGSAFSGSGCPDLIGVLPGGAGRAFGIEVKRPGGGECSALQLRALWSWAERGAAAGVARSVGEALAICGLD